MPSRDLARGDKYSGALRSKESIASECSHIVLVYEQLPSVKILIAHETLSISRSAHSTGHPIFVTLSSRIAAQR